MYKNEKFPKNTTFLVSIFMFTLITFILTFKEVKRHLTNLYFEFRVKGWIRFWNVEFMNKYLIF